MKNRALNAHTDSRDEPIASDPLRRFSGVQARAERQEATPSGLPAEDVVRPLISIGAPADPALLEPTYAYLSAYCFAVLPPQVAQKLNVAIYELYANALRYGSGEGEVRLEIWRNTGGAGLRVSNWAEAAQVERLKQQVRRVQEDAAAAFSAEMNRFAGASQPPPMLGLVRVAHEVGLPLALLQHDHQVAISTWCGT